MEIRDRLKSYLLKEKYKIILASLLCLLFVICQMSQPFLLGRALDTVSQNNRDMFYIYLIIL